jgi:hypothetical protein
MGPVFQQKPRASRPCCTAAEQRQATSRQLGEVVGRTTQIGGGRERELCECASGPGLGPATAVRQPCSMLMVTQVVTPTPTLNPACSGRAAAYSQLIKHSFQTKANFFWGLTGAPPPITAPETDSHPL